jgi:Tfp pilus assembly protein PilO
MRKLTKLEKFGLIAAILVSGTYFYMGRVYDPQAEALKKTISKLNSTIKEYNTSVELPPLVPMRKAVEQKREQLDTLKQELREVGGRTGAADEVARLIDEVGHRAGANNLLILSLAPGKRIEEELYSWDVFDLRLFGDYRQLIRFVEALKEMPEPVQVRNLALEKANGRSGRVLVSLQLMI